MSLTTYLSYCKCLQLMWSLIFYSFPRDEKHNFTRVLIFSLLTLTKVSLSLSLTAAVPSSSIYNLHYSSWCTTNPSVAKIDQDKFK